jgi:transglutaminase-like putative cysteine protease
MGFWGVPISVQSTKTNPIDTDVSTMDTITQMIALARLSALSSEVHHIVNTCLSSLPKSHSVKDLVRAIYYWIKGNVVFVQDETILAGQLGMPSDRELLISPMVLVNMEQPMGDCDDFSVLAAACLCAAQVQCGFCAIAADRDMPWKFSHVYVVAWIDGERIPFDASHGEYLGWEYKDITRRMEWRVN